ncbi:hypothetical protein EBH_0066090 [Eimeria brunetti]|uniref:Uncharacterized protein n=1 Tax=Eimeria brunetti TaxID=51314 RepID=U6L7S6_9EIME|nr:hypothetical protein EBH_0066090 [Eimeria brunetti]
MPTQLAFAVGGLHAQQGNTQPTAPGETVTWAPDQMLPGTATPPLGAQRRLIGLKGKGERQGKVEEGAKRLRLEPLTEETQLQHTPPPLDPDVDLLIDSVLSEVNVLFSDDVWILDDEPPHPPGDLSPGGRHPALGGSVDWSHADTVSGEGPSSPSIFPSYRTEPEEQTDNGLPLPPVSSGRHARRGLASGVAGLHRGPPGLAAEVNFRYDHVTREPPQAPTAGTLVRRKGVPTSSEQLVADTLPSSSRASPFTPELASAPTPFLNSASVEQTASAADLPSDAIITWLAGSFSGVPHNILRMHPFYRHPKYQPGLNTRSFNAPLATSPASARRNPNSELAKCRDIMRKVSLTPQDLEELLIQAERLCAYATTKMPVKYRRGQAGYAIDTLGTIFLVLDTLHCAAEVLGDKSSKQLWWPLVVRHIESAKFVPKKELPTTDRHFRNSKVARALNTALDYYRRGVRPPAVMVIGLKEALLCEPFPYSKFQDQQWNTWRNDAANFRRSIQLTLAGRK